MRGSLTDSSLLFLGFPLESWTFRVLFRLIMTLEGCAKLKQYSHVGVQVDPEAHSQADVERARKYLESYFGADRSAGRGRGEPRIDIYWGSAADFLKELHSQLAKTKEDEDQVSMIFYGGVRWLVLRRCASPWRRCGPRRRSPRRGIPTSGRGRWSSESGCGAATRRSPRSISC